MVCGVSPWAESIFRILTLLKNSFSLQGLSYGGIRFQNPDFLKSCEASPLGEYIFRILTFCLGNSAVTRAGVTCCPRLGELAGAAHSHCP